MQAQSDSDNDDAVLRQPAAPARISDDLMMEIARSRSYYSQNQALFALWQYTTHLRLRGGGRWGYPEEHPMAYSNLSLAIIAGGFWLVFSGQ